MEIFWEKPDWEEHDPHLTKLKSMPFRRPFPFIPEKKGLYVIRGPRQVGKSCWLKTVLKEYAKKESCFYLSCENVTDHKELAEVLKSLRDRRVVLLDEINFVKDWDRAVKHEVDGGHTTILMLTGSHAWDLKRGADQMPGRFEGGGDYHLLPMDFSEFEQVRKQAGWMLANRIEELRAYFRVGGFPSAVAEAGPAAVKPKKAMATYLRWLIGDVIKLGKQESYLKELFIQFAKTLQTPLSHNTLAKKTRIASHNTVQEYVELLESCFALRTLFEVDMDTGAYRFRKDKKFYFTDPLLYWMAVDLSGEKPPANAEEQLAEMVAHEYLARRFQRFGYLRTQGGEIDFLLPKNWALEIKWSEIPTNLSKTYKNILIPQKIVWTHGNFLVECPAQIPTRAPSER